LKIGKSTIALAARENGTREAAAGAAGADVWIALDSLPGFIATASLLERKLPSQPKRE